MMDPRTIMFRAEGAKRGTCARCIFEHERSSVCHIAGEEARRRQIEDCEAGYVYLPVETDPRQIDILEALPDDGEKPATE